MLLSENKLVTIIKMIDIYHISDSIDEIFRK